jgi:hypothetical protein
VPAQPGGPPAVTSLNVSSIAVAAVPGGYRVSGQATGAYELMLTR